jgi:histidine kinase/histidine kinase/DNA gyrase B/HSP90-like ATPase
MAREARRDAWIYPAAWIALSTIYAAAFFANGVGVGLALRNAVANLLPDALLGLLVLRLPEVLPWPEGRKGRFFAVHLGFVAAFLALAGAGWVALIALDSLLFGGEVAVRINYRILPFRAVNDVLIYGTLAGIAYARRNAERTAQAEALRARASLEAMRSQLNPHFILNTFHALVGLVRREPAVAESALERLGDLLRYSLRIHRDGIDEVPLREERAFVESYLALERLRLGERLQVSIEVPSAALHCLVPTFAVQILVENAIRHAIAPRAAGGLLQIRVEQNDGRLRIAVQDEGAGEAAEARFEGSRMGLRLLQERLSALYGGRAKLALRSVEGGTCADLELPARRTVEEEL